MLHPPHGGAAVAQDQNRRIIRFSIGRSEDNGQDGELRTAKLEKELQLGRRCKILADREEGRVVDADEICRVNCQLIIDCREELLAIPQIVAAQVATMTEPPKTLKLKAVSGVQPWLAASPDASFSAD